MIQFIFQYACSGCAFRWCGLGGQWDIQKQNENRKDDVKMSIKISMAAARLNAGLTQKKVCETLGISKTTLVNYEKGRTIPDCKIAGELANLYKMPVDNIKFF